VENPMRMRTATLLEDLLTDPMKGVKGKIKRGKIKISPPKINLGSLLTLGVTIALWRFLVILLRGCRKSVVSLKGDP